MKIILTIFSILCITSVGLCQLSPEDSSRYESSIRQFLSASNEIDEIIAIEKFRLENPLIELIALYDENSHGNGLLHLYEINNGSPKIIFETYAVDQNLSEYDEASFKKYGYFATMFKEGFLSCSFTDMNGDGFEDLVLRGTIQFIGESEKVKKENAVQQVFIWNPQKHTFEEDLSRKKGFSFE